MPVGSISPRIYAPKPKVAPSPIKSSRPNYRAPELPKPVEEPPRVEPSFGSFVSQRNSNHSSNGPMTHLPIYEDEATGETEETRIRGAGGTTANLTSDSEMDSLRQYIDIVKNELSFMHSKVKKAKEQIE